MASLAEYVARLHCDSSADKEFHDNPKDAMTKFGLSEQQQQVLLAAKNDPKAIAAAIDADYKAASPQMAHSSVNDCKLGSLTQFVAFLHSDTDQEAQFRKDPKKLMQEWRLSETHQQLLLDAENNKDAIAKAIQAEHSPQAPMTAYSSVNNMNIPSGGGK